MDETTLSLDPLLGACWMKIGQQKRFTVTKPGIKQKWHVFGGYDWVNDTITWTVA